MITLTEEAIRELRRKGTQVKSKKTGKTVALLIPTRRAKTIPEVAKQQAKAPDTTLEANYRALLAVVGTLSESVKQLRAAPVVESKVDEKPTRWEFTIQRDDRGLIKTIEAEAK